MTTILGQTYSATLTFDANGAPNGVTAVNKESLVSGTIAAITSVLTADKIVCGAGKTLATLAVPYATAVLAARAQTGSLKWNPFSAN